MEKRLIYYIKLIIISLSLFIFNTCDIFLGSTDVETFIEEGLSIIYVQSLVNLDTGSSFDYISSSETTIQLNTINPKNLDAIYTISTTDNSKVDTEIVLDDSDALINKLYLTVDPSLDAELSDIEFTMSIYATATDKTYDSETITVSCNSTPNSISSLNISTTDDDEIQLISTIPTEETDIDLSYIKISWYSSNDTENVSNTIEDLTNEQITNTTIIDNINSDETYYFTITVVDDAGQSSTKVSSSYQLNDTEVTLDMSETYTLKYYNNGTLESSTSYNENDIITVDSTCNSGPDGKTFAGWDTDVSADTTVYYEAESGTDKLNITMGTTDITLYAVWVEGTPIRTVEEFYEISSDTDLTDTDYSLTSDLDMSGISLSPIGTETNNFTKSFYGLDHILSNVSMTATTAGYGLFGFISGSGSVENLNLTSVTLTNDDSYNYVGILIGYVDVGSVDSCSVSGSMTISGKQNGGLVGKLYGASSTISNSTVSLTSFSGTGYSHGGLVGYMWADTISNCSVTAVIDLSGGGNDIGGIVGHLNDTGTISYCTFSGTINSDGSYVGGIVGSADWNSTEVAEDEVSLEIDNCEVLDGTTIEASDYTGGITGSILGATDYTENSFISNCTVNNLTITDGDVYMGGLSGYAGYSTITANSLTGTIEISSKDNYIGGLIGKVSDCNSITENNINKLIIASSNENTGGLIGLAYNCLDISSNTISDLTIEECSYYTGGLIGLADTITTISENSIGNGSMYIDGTNDHYGGLIGYARDCTNITENSIGNATSALIETTGDLVGGLIGELNTCTTISGNETTISTIVACEYLGGFIGFVYDCYEISSNTTTTTYLEGTGYIGGFIAYTKEVDSITNNDVTTTTISGSTTYSEFIYSDYSNTDFTTSNTINGITY